jgi:hypothetical protein
LNRAGLDTKNMLKNTPELDGRLAAAVS